MTLSVVVEQRSCRDVEDTNVLDGNALADKVKINLNMFDALVLNGVSGEVNGTDVVVIDQSGSRQGIVQLHKQLTKLKRLCHIVSHSAVLRLNARTRDDVLTLGGPGDDVVAQEHHVARSGPMSVRTTGSVNISVDDKVRCRGVAKKQALVDGALEAPNDAHSSREMGLTGVVHVEAHLLDREAMLDLVKVRY
jgi:hypothetical protein